MSHKYVKFFKIENKIDAQTYRFILLNIYRIYDIFYVSLLKNYYYKKTINMRNNLYKFQN